MATQEGYFSLTPAGDVKLFIPGKGNFTMKVKEGRLNIMFHDFGMIKILPVVSNVVEIDAEVRD